MLAGVIITVINNTHADTWSRPIICNITPLLSYESGNGSLESLGVVGGGVIREGVEVMMDGVEGGRKARFVGKLTCEGKWIGVEEKNLSWI